MENNQSTKIFSECSKLLPSSDYFNNTLVLKSNIQIQKNDLEFIVLYFETLMNNYECGDYGEIIEYFYDETEKHLMVRCLQNNIKDEILKRKFFYFENYEFESFPNEIKSSFETNRNYLIIQNISQELGVNRIELYLKHLCPNHKLLDVSMSNIYKDTVYAQFDHDIDMNDVSLNWSIKPVLCNREIKIHEAYDTNRIFMKLNRKNKKTGDLYRYLVINFRVRNTLYWQSIGNLDQSSFIIVKFSNVDAKIEFLQNYKIDANYVELIENNWNEHIELNINENKEEAENMDSLEQVDFILSYVVDNAVQTQLDESNSHLHLEMSLSSQNDAQLDESNSHLHLEMSLSSQNDAQEYKSSSNHQIDDILLANNNDNDETVSSDSSPPTAAATTSLNDQDLDTIEDVNTAAAENDNIDDIIQETINTSKMKLLTRKFRKNTHRYTRKTRTIETGLTTKYATDRAQRILLCEFCPYRTKKTSRMRDHESRHNTTGDNEEFKCKECSFYAKSKNSMTVHAKVHTNSKFTIKTEAI